MILNVPLVIQKKNSKDCGLVGLEMILKYHGINKSIKDLKKYLKVDKSGTYAPQLGSYMINNGFDVEIITLHPGLFTKKDEGMNKKDVLKRFEYFKSISKKRQNKKVLSYFIDYLNDGGKINVKIPDSMDIKEEIENKNPMGALLTSNFLNGDKPKFNFHFNVVRGIDKQFIYVNDPSWDKRGGRKRYLIKDFLFGLYSSSYGDLDNGCLIKFKYNQK